MAARLPVSRWKSRHVVGTASALRAGTVTFLRVKLSVIALVASMLAATGGAVFAQAFHPVCTARHHECGKTAKVSRCCCGDQGTAGNDATPVQSRSEVRADVVAAPLTPVVQVAPAPRPLTPVHTSFSRLHDAFSERDPALKSAFAAGGRR